MLYFSLNYLKIRILGRFHHFIGHEGPQGEQRYSSTLFLTSALEGGEGSASRPGRTLLRERPGTHFTGGGVGLRDGLDRCGESRPHRDSIPGPSSPQRVAIPTTLSGPQILVLNFHIYIGYFWMSREFFFFVKLLVFCYILLHYISKEMPVKLRFFIIQNIHYFLFLPSFAVTVKIKVKRVKISLSLPWSRVGGLDAQIQLFLNSALEGCEFGNTRPITIVIYV